ncbi:MAG: VOC family protein [Gemmatimonadetes bacterium]|nr:VOC family protein [Gemmatimonadota bacterium]
MTNCKRTRAFYEAGLGFTVDWEAPVRARLARLRAAHALRAIAFPYRAWRGLSGRRRPYFVVDDVGALYREISHRGTKPLELPGATEWHARGMTVSDPDGNKLRFSTAVTQ